MRIDSEGKIYRDGDSSGSSSADGIQCEMPGCLLSNITVPVGFDQSDMGQVAYAGQDCGYRVIKSINGENKYVCPKTPLFLHGYSNIDELPPPQLPGGSIATDRSGYSPVIYEPTPPLPRRKKNMMPVVIFFIAIALVGLTGFGYWLTNGHLLAFLSSNQPSNVAEPPHNNVGNGHAGAVEDPAFNEQPVYPQYPGSPLEVGSRGDDVILLQSSLNEIGYYFDSVPTDLVLDGSFGNLTRASVTSFQEYIGLDATGVVDQITWDTIMITLIELRNSGIGLQGNNPQNLFSETISVTSTIAEIQQTELAVGGSTETWDENGVFADGNGTEGEPFIIVTPQQLSNVRSNLNSHFRLGQNIDLNGIPFEMIGSGGFRSGEWNSENGFQGVFDGDDFVISGLDIRSSSQCTGLFALVGANGVVRNLHVSGSARTSSNDANNAIGLISGFNLGLIERSTVVASIEGAGRYAMVGCLIGANDGVIQYSVSDGEVRGRGEYVKTGGIAGLNLHDGLIKDSRNVANVFSEYRAGAITGWNDGETIGNEENGVVRDGE